jgi:hypothetical protein
MGNAHLRPSNGSVCSPEWTTTQIPLAEIKVIVDLEPDVAAARITEHCKSRASVALAESRHFRSLRSFTGSSGSWAFRTVHTKRRR